MLATSCTFAPPSVLPDISPSRGEIGSFTARLPFCSVGNWRPSLPQLISPLEGEMSGRTEGGGAEHDVERRLP